MSLWSRLLHFFGLHGEDKRCPEARLLASDLILALALLPGGVLADLPKEAAAIESSFTDGHPTEQIAAAIELQKRIAAAIPPENLARMVAHLRARFALAAGPLEEARHLASAPSLSSAAPAAVWRAEAVALLDRLALLYRVSHQRDEIIRWIRRTSVASVASLLLLLLLIGVVTKISAAALTAWLDLKDEAGLLATFKSVTTYMVVCVAGAGGALVSVLRRTELVIASEPLAIDPVRQISGLRHGRTGIVVALLTGPVFALVAFLLLASGIVIINGLTPDLLDCRELKNTGVGPCVTAPIFVLDQLTAFATPADAARMLVWTFLAGFAEQFVPDVLDRFTGRVLEDKTMFGAPPPESGTAQPPPFATDTQNTSPAWFKTPPAP